MFGVAVISKHAWSGRFLFPLSVSQTLLLLPFDWSSEPTLLLRGILNGAVNEKPFGRTEMKLGDQEIVFASGVHFCRGSRSVFLSRARELGASQMPPFLGQGYNPTLVDDCKVGGAVKSFVFLLVCGFPKVRKQWLFMAVMEHEGDEWVKGV